MTLFFFLRDYEKVRKVFEIYGKRAPEQYPNFVVEELKICGIYMDSNELEYGKLNTNYTV